MSDKTKKDYKRLWELAIAGKKVVCFAEYDYYGKPARDVCNTRCWMDTRCWMGTFGISARGKTYVFADNEEDFIKQCEAAHIEFIDPELPVEKEGEVKRVKKVWELDWRDKSIHRHMAFGATQLRKVARGIRDYKDSPEWLGHAEEAEGAARMLETWMKGLKENKQESEVEK